MNSSLQTNTFHIEAFRPELQDQTVEFIKAVWTDLGRVLRRDGAGSDIFSISRTYQQNGGEFWLAREGAAIVGTVGIQVLDRKRVLLRRWYVLPEKRGMGIGSKLLKIALGYAKTRSFETVWLSTRRESVEAHRIFKKHGFVLITHLSLSYATDLYMQLRLK